MSRSTDHLYVVSGEEEYDQAEKNEPVELRAQEKDDPVPPSVVRVKP
jgi:hypothetical protein